jgi:hypothetical protein
MEYKGRTLKVGSNELNFMQEIEEVRDTPFGYFVEVKDEPGNNCRNVYLVSLDGHIKWQIEAIGYTPETRNWQYVGINYKNNTLWATNSIGFAVTLDPETGKILERKFTK